MMKKEIKNLILFPFNVLYKMSPKMALKALFRLKCKRKLDLENPQSYNEKLNWLKLYYRSDLMPICADKYLARGYISDKGYGEYLPKLLWHGSNPEEIPFDELPDKFIIKTTSGSGNNIVCHDKSELNRADVCKKLRSMLKEKYLPCYGEWHYEKIKSQIIVEELLSDGKNVVPIDYKFFCFNNLNKGDVGCIAVDLGRYVDHRRNILDAEWNFDPNISFGFKRDLEAEVKKPEQYEKMKKIAKDLAEPFPHCRVDFFVIGEKFYIGELTFFNGAGFDVVSPYEYNLKMGSWIDLNNLKRE